MPAYNASDHAIGADFGDSPVTRGGTGVELDWARHAAIVQAEAEGTIFAVGDVLGDLGRLAEVLHAGGGECGAGLPGRFDRLRAAVAGCAAVLGGAAGSGGEVGRARDRDDGNHEEQFLAEPSTEKSAEFRAELKRRG